MKNGCEECVVYAWKTIQKMAKLFEPSLYLCFKTEAKFNKESPRRSSYVTQHEETTVFTVIKRKFVLNIIQSSHSYSAKTEFGL